MGYFLKWVFLLNCLGFVGSITFAQPVDTLRTCIEQDVDNVAINREGYEHPTNTQMLVVEYELSQKMFKDIYSKGRKDVYVQLCFNNELITELDPNACGDLGRVKSRRGKLRIEFNRLLSGEPESVYLFAIPIEQEKPPLKKWVLKSFLSPHWGHKQINTFNNLTDLANGNAELGDIDTLLAQKTKTKKRKTAGIIGGLLVVGGLIKLNSMENYSTAKRKRDEGNIELMRNFYDLSVREHRTALVFVEAALLVDLGNVISVFSKGNKKMKDYHRNKPKSKNKKCADW